MLVDYGFEDLGACAGLRSMEVRFKMIVRIGVWSAYTILKIGLETRCIFCVKDSEGEPGSTSSPEYRIV